MALSQETPPTLHRKHFREDTQPPLASEDFTEDEDNFEDAAEEHPIGEMELSAAFEECELAIRRFFNNDLIGAMKIMKPRSQTSLYHSLGTSIFEFIPAMLTFDHEQITRALAAIKISISICNKHRRNYTIVESIYKKVNYESYTDLEAHAELCYAEALLLHAAMTIMEGEDLAGLIKGTLKVKSCYSSYKECVKIMEKKTWMSEDSKIQFKSGVRLGTATFNLMISLLPPKIIRMLEFVGFSGNKEVGLSELELGGREPGMRSVLCELTLLAYHLVVTHFTGASHDLPMCENILDKELKVYPEGVWFLVFQGRLEFFKGQFEEALQTYRRVSVAQDMWPQFTHLCYWEMLWVNSLLLRWRDAASNAQLLIEESTWSKTIYSYTMGAVLLQLGDDMNPTEREHCNDLMRNAFYYKQRIAGKSLPMEKFVIRRCERYRAQGGRLVLPAIELICLWNLFPVLAKKEIHAQNVLKLIETTREQLESGAHALPGGYEADNLALARYLHGSCLAALGLPRLALQTLQSVAALKRNLKEDTFLLPYTVTEMAMCMYRLGDIAKAFRTLQDARRLFSGYALESRLHFRIHSKMQMIKARINSLSPSAQSVTQLAF